MIRNFTGSVWANYTNNNSADGNGVFASNGSGAGCVAERAGSWWGSSSANFNPSRVVPTGPENSPRTFSIKYWRRAA